MRKILMAHDLSLRCNIALERAVRLAQQAGAELEVVHVVQDDLPAAIVERRKAEATEAITGHLASLPDGLQGTIPVHVVTGKDYTDILAQADRTGADLIVLGVHREDALRNLVIGATAERVIGFGRQPVLVVNDPPHGPYRRVLATLEFSDAARRAVEFALALLPQAEFRLVQSSTLAGTHANVQIHGDRDEQLMGSIKAELASVHRPGGPDAAMLDVVVCHDPPLEMIRQQVAEFHPDVLVIGVQRHIGLSRAVIGAIAEDLLAQPPCDIIAVHA
jgi:nucleotide-binding universal stress UspA family protein